MNKILLVITIICCFTGTTHADIFALGDLPGGDVVSHAEGVSANGTFVVGYSSSANGTEAFLWSHSGGMVGLGDLGLGLFDSRAFGVSDDGTVVVGRGENFGGYDEAFRWTQSGGMVGLGFLPGGSHSHAVGVSADGSAVAGGSFNEAFRWTQSGGMVGIGDLPGGVFSSGARGISTDGTAIVGSSESANGTEAFRWTQATGMVGLGDLPGGSFRSIAYGVSADGSFVVGRSATVTNSLNEGFLWSQSSGMIGLGGLPGGNFASRVYAVSADGSVVVGHGNGSNGGEAIIWTPNGGMVSLAGLLASQGDDLSHWTSLENADDVSADGRTVVGHGVNINGDVEAFLATLIADATTVVPDSFLVTRGSYVAGGVAELAESDNTDLSIQRATADTQSRTELEIKSTSPVANPASLEVTLEGAVFARSQVDQTIELFDFVAATWEEVDRRAATRFTDSTVTVAATGDLSRFVEPGTMCIEARIRYQSLNQRQQFSSNTDQFIWTIGQ